MDDFDFDDFSLGWIMGGGSLILLGIIALILLATGVL